MAFLPRSIYRSRQFFHSVGASIDDEDRAEVARLLTEGQQRLFFSVTPRDQRHCLDVLHALPPEASSDHDLLVAALLHDVGKGRVRLWHRVVYVLARAVSPQLLRLLASRIGGVASIVNHSERGAALVEATGASAEVVRLVRHHETAIPDDDPRLAMLRAADESC